VGCGPDGGGIIRDGLVNAPGQARSGKDQATFYLHQGGTSEQQTESIRWRVYPTGANQREPVAPGTVERLHQVDAQVARRPTHQPASRAVLHAAGHHHAAHAAFDRGRKQRRYALAVQVGGKAEQEGTGRKAIRERMPYPIQVPGPLVVAPRAACCRAARFQRKKRRIALEASQHLAALASRLLYAGAGTVAQPDAQGNRQGCGPFKLPRDRLESVALWLGWIPDGILAWPPLDPRGWRERRLGNGSDLQIAHAKPCQGAKRDGMGIQFRAQPDRTGKRDAQGGALEIRRRAHMAERFDDRWPQRQSLQRCGGTKRQIPSTFGGKAK
jgi:hypothetical protein